MSRKWWVAVMALGLVLVLAGVAWIVYYATQTGDDLNASTGAYESDSWWPIAGFFLSFIGGTMISIGSMGWMFSWFSGDDDDSRYTEPSAMLRQAVPTTRVGWGPDPEQDRPETR
jgi:hypothetical protein